MLELDNPQVDVRDVHGMNAATPAIVVVAFNRPVALGALLETLRAAAIPDGVTLVISVEGGAPSSVIEMASTFDWPHGPKRVILQLRRLGLREHILRSGDLSEEYGAVIVLEDDLILSPHFYGYASQALSAFSATPVVGGVALYSYMLNEFSNLDFEPLNDGGDVYFLQIACSWGQAWTWEQWRLFRAWYETAKDLPFDSGRPLPRQLMAWKPTSWKKYFIKYLVETDRYFAYPRYALTSNTARPGTHTKRPVSIYQSPLEMRPRRWRFTDPSTSVAVYDAFYELTPQALNRLEPSFPATGLDVDIWGDKPIAARSGTFILAAGGSAKGARRFGGAGAPIEAIVANGEPGSLVSLGPKGARQRRSLWDRYRLIRATSPANARSKLMFSVLKPIQTEMKILSSQWRESRSRR